MTDLVRTPTRPRQALRRSAAALAAATLLALAGTALAHGGWGAGPGGLDGRGPAAPGWMHGPGASYGPGAMHGPAGMRHHGAFGAGLRRGGAAGPVATLTPRAMQALPLGTDVTVTSYAEDPAEGAAPQAVLTATVGEVSEVAFVQEVGAAAQEAAYLQVEVGPRTRRVELPEDAAARPATAGRLPGLGALELGQTVEVAVFGGRDDAAPQATLRFSYGEDSAAAFRAELEDALADAAAVEVTLPAQQRTVDLSAVRARRQAPDGGWGPGMGWDDRPRGPGMGWGDAPRGPGMGWGDGPADPRRPGRR
jgi:hypothetical protein